MVDWTQIPENPGKSNFDNLLAIFHRQVPERPTMFEFFLNERLHTQLASQSQRELESPYAEQRQVMRAYYRAGYDYVNVLVPDTQLDMMALDPDWLLDIYAANTALISDHSIPPGTTLETYTFGLNLVMEMGIYA